MVAIQLRWACVIVVFAQRTTSEYSFTELEGWTAEFADALWMKALLTRFKHI